MDVDKALEYGISATANRAVYAHSKEVSDEWLAAAHALRAHRDALIDAQPVAEEVLRISATKGVSGVTRGLAMLDLAPALARVVKGGGGDGKEAAC